MHLEKFQVGNAFQPGLSTMCKNLTNWYNRLENVDRYKNRVIDRTPAGGRKSNRFSLNKPKSETEDSVESKNVKSLF